MIKIQCDEHIKKSVTGGLKAKGIDAYSVDEEDLKGYSDEELLSYCVLKKRVLLTNDEDFLRLAKIKPHNGIIFLTTQFVSVGDTIRAVVRLVDRIPDTEFASSVFLFHNSRLGELSESENPQIRRV